ncbi:MAG: hypothetical protein KAR19_05270 [Bacteroidales bacterium]|nr:hypothetical protein [Bacteroidales bacterium]
MNRNSDRSIRLANYIYDDLAPEEVVTIEQELLEDPELSESYRLNMQVKDYLKAKIQLEEMKSDPYLDEAEKLAELAFESDSNEQEMPSGRHNGISGLIRHRFIYSSAIAAAIAVLVILRVFLPFTTPDRLFRDYYEPLDASDYSQRGEANDLYLNLSEGINSYIQGNYEQSNLLFNQMGSVHSDQPEVQLFTGLTYMALEQYGIARDILDSYIEDNYRYLPEASWYLSLCYLKTGDVEKARDLLSQLDAYDGMYKEDAQSLERKLRRIK